MEFELDNEMKDEFYQEVKQLQRELSLLVIKLEKNLDRPEIFEAFGQTIDRIYGTASTLGFTEFANYCKAMKDITYMCSHTRNPIGQKKVFAMMVNSIDNLNIFMKGIYDPNELLKVASQIKIALHKVTTLEKSCFASVKDKKSCA